MPTINITEKDLTNVAATELNSNAVYIPGMTMWHEINQTIPDEFPGTGVITYVDNLSDFKEMFGSRAYKWVVQDQSVGYITHYDYSWIFAAMLLSMGLPVYYEVPRRTQDKTKNDYNVAIDEFSYTSEGYSEVQNPVDRLNAAIGYGTSSVPVTTPQKFWNRLQDKSLYANLAFITTGGYENVKVIYDETTAGTTINTEILSYIASILKSRTDVTAMPGLPDLSVAEKVDTIDLIGSIYKSIYNIFDANCKSYAIGTTTACVFAADDINGTDSGAGSITLPSHAAYLLAYANSLHNNNAEWFAPAGKDRGQIPYLIAPTVEFGELDCKSFEAVEVADSQYIALVPVCKVEQFGQNIIWGNRTMLPFTDTTTTQKASGFANVRLGANNIKKTIYRSCLNNMYDQNDDILWVNLKSDIIPVMDKMLYGRGCKGYRLVRKINKRRETMSAIVRYIPIEAAEEFGIEIELTDSLDTTEEE